MVVPVGAETVAQSEFPALENGLPIGQDPAPSVTENTYGSLSLRQTDVGRIEKISVPQNGEENTGHSTHPSVSEDGRWIAFASDSSRISTGDSNGQSDVFLYDRDQGMVTMIPDETRNFYGRASYAPVISMDGRYVLFASEADTIVEHVEFGEWVNLYRYDRDTREIIAVAEGVSMPSESGRTYAMSANGRYVAYWSYAANGSDEDFNTNWDVYYTDLHTGLTTSITRHAKAELIYPYTAQHTIWMTPDGRYVVFESDQPDLVNDDSNDASDVFLYDALSGDIERMSVSTSGAEGDRGSETASVSADGRYVVFASSATNLGEEALPTGQRALYVRDRVLGTTERIPPISIDPASYPVGIPIFSADGRHVTYAWSQFGEERIYLFDRHDGTSEGMVHGTNGEPGDGNSHTPYLTSNGQFVVFVSDAVNLGDEPEQDAYTDIYWMELITAKEPLPVWPAGASLMQGAVGGSYVFLTWPAAEGGSGAPVYRVTATEQDGTKRTVAVTYNTELLATGLEMLENYEFQVIAGNDHYDFDAASGLTLHVSTTVTENTPPGKVAGLAATSAPGKLLLSWQDPDDPDFIGTLVSWRISGTGVEFQLPMIRAGIQQQAELLGIVNNQLYEVRVATVDAEGNVAEPSVVLVNSDEGFAIDRISVSDTGKQMYPLVDYFRDFYPIDTDLSDDGRYAVFSGHAGGLLPDLDDYTLQQVFLYDNVTHQLQLISYATSDDRIGDKEPGYSASLQPRISGDGRFIVFITSAGNVVGFEDMGLYNSVALYDRDADGNGIFDEVEGVSTELISPLISSDYDGYTEPDINRDGTKIIYRSARPDTPDNKLYLFQRELYWDPYDWAWDPEYAPALTELALTAGDYEWLVLSGDGEYAAVVTDVALDPADTNGRPDLYVVSITDLQAEMIEVPGAGEEAVWKSPSISSDGHFLTFAYAEDEDTEHYDIYIYDRTTQTSNLIVSSLTDRAAGQTVISGDGSAIVYTGVADESDEHTQVWLYELAKGERQLISQSYKGEPGNDSSSNPAISADGSAVAFTSLSDNLATGDTNAFEDVYYVRLGDAAAEPDTEPPVWPAGATLDVLEKTHESTTLAWTPALDENGISTYRIFKDDELATTVAGTHSSAVISGLQPLTSYHFSIEAVDSSGHVTASRLSVTTETLEAPIDDQIHIYDAKVTAAQTYRAYIDIGAEIGLVMKGDSGPGWQAEAEVEYNTVTGDTLSEIVPMSMDTPNVYTGSFIANLDFAEIVQVRIQLTDGTRTAERDALASPIYVGASAMILLDEDMAEQLHGGYIKLSHAQMNAYAGQLLDRQAIDGMVAYEWHGLPATHKGVEYSIQLVDEMGIQATLDAPSINLKLGTATEYQVTGQLPVVLAGNLYFPASDETHWARVTVQQDQRVLYSDLVNINDPASQYVVRGVKDGAKLTMIVDPQEARMKQTIATKQVEGSGWQTFDIEVQPRLKASLSGRVTDARGQPVAGATVTAHQTISGENVQVQAVSGHDGTYVVEVYEGVGHVSASKLTYDSSEKRVIVFQPGDDRVLDLRLPDQSLAQIKLDVYMTTAEGDWTGPLNLNSNVVRNLQIHGSHSLKNNIVQGDNLLSIYAKPGETVQWCVDMLDEDARACGSTVLDERAQGHIELWLEPANAFVQGQLRAETAEVSSASFELYAVDEAGKRIRVSKQMGDSDFSIAIQDAGTYYLSIKDGEGRTAARQFTVNPGSAIDLGDILLVEAGVYGTQAGNEVIASPVRLMPGELFQARVRYRNASASETTDSQLLFPIPAGAQLADHGVLVDGQLVEPDWIESHTAVVDLGTISAGDEGVVVLYLQLDDDYPASVISLAPSMAFTQAARSVTELFGSVIVAVEQISLQAPEVTGNRDLIVTGRAPVGSLVSIYDQDKLLGEALATAAGRWSATVRIGEQGRSSRHKLRAVAEREAESWSTQETVVTYEHDFPEISDVTLQQSKTVTFQPTEGVAIFPFTYDFHAPFAVSMSFKNNERVRDIKVAIGDMQEVPMIHTGGGQYQAIIGKGKHAPGPIYVSYQVKKNMSFTELPSDEEIRERLPVTFQEMESTVDDVAQSASNPYYLRASHGGTTSVKGDKVELSGTFSFDEVEYPMTDFDAIYEETTGIPLYGFSMNYAVRGDTFSYALTGYIPEEKFREAGAEVAVQHLFETMAAELGSEPSRKDRVTIAASVRGAINAIKVTYNGTIKQHGKVPWELYEFYDDVTDTWENKEKLEKLEELIDQAASSCSPAASRKHRQRANDIADKYMAHEVAKWAMLAGAAALGPSTFGIGTVLLFIATEMVEKVMDDKIDREIDQLKADIGKDKDCQDDEPEEEKFEQKKRKIAQPVWNHDPSGYVYEVEPDNRIEGVTATAFYWEEAEQYWQMWDADWFGQLNPQSTNLQGRYAWDVPEGLWKVQYEKEGYVTAESDELRVLPPHFNVNIPMDSVLPPMAVQARLDAAAEPAYIEFTFNRHTDIATIHEMMVAVKGHTEDGEVIEFDGSVTPVDELHYKGRDVARIYRFHLLSSAPLNEVDAMTLHVSAGVQSYYGVPMTEPATLDVAMEDYPPGQVADVKAIGVVNGIMLEWSDPEDSDFTEVLIRWKASGEDSFSDPIVVPKGGQFAIIGDLNSSTRYEVFIQTVDERDNRTDYSVTVRTGAEEVVPNLHPPTQVENVAVAAEATRMKLTWTVPEPGGELDTVQIEWTRADGDHPTQRAEVAKGLLEYVITGLVPATEYKVTVNAMSELGNLAEGTLLFIRTLEEGSSGGEEPGTGEEEPGADDEEPGAGEGEPGTDGGEPGTGGMDGDGSETGGASSDSEDLSTHLITEQGGDIAAFHHQLRLMIPSGTFAKPVELELRRLVKVQVPDGGDWTAVSDAYQLISSDGQQPSLSLRLQLAYDRQLLNGVDPQRLGIYREDPEKPVVWKYVGGTVDIGAATIQTDVNELGTYAVLLYNPVFGDLMDHWSRDQVQVLISRHIVHGDGERRFSPERSITRAELVKLLVEIITLHHEPPVGKSAIAFSDVSETAWYSEAVRLASLWGLAQGDQGRFRPNDLVTRQEMVVLMMRAVQLLGQQVEVGQSVVATDSLQAYVDADEIAVWARDAFAAAIGAGLVNGMAADRLGPAETSTRAQAAVVIYRLLDTMDFL